MAKKQIGFLKLQILAGKASPAPPVGPALGQHGVNIMEFCKAFNAKTQDQSGKTIPVEITVYADRSFSFVTKTPPVPTLLIEAAKIAKGSGEPNKEKVGNVSMADVKKIAEIKMPDLNAYNIDGAINMIIGTARSMGIEVKKIIMAKSRRYNDLYKRVDRDVFYTLSDGIGMIRSGSVKFDETVDIAVNLGVDPRHADQLVRGTVALPNGTGKDVKVLVITQGENIALAESAGADLVGSDEYISKIKGGWVGVDTIIVTPDMMAKVGQLGKILGPKGLMPSPKSGTVTTDVTRAVKEIKSGRIEYRVDKQGIVHSVLGKVGFGSDKLLENALVFMGAIKSARPSSVKGTYLKKVTISSTMGPGIKIDVNSIAS